MAKRKITLLNTGRDSIQRLVAEFNTNAEGGAYMTIENYDPDSPEVEATLLGLIDGAQRKLIDKNNALDLD